MLYSDLLNKNLILFSMFISVVLSFITTYIWIGIILVILLALFIHYKENIIIPIIIFSFLTITSDINIESRVFINIVSIIILLFLFFKKYGLELTYLKQIPIPLIAFTFIVIISMLVSSIFSLNFLRGLEYIIKQIIFFTLIYILYSFIESNKQVKTYLYSLILAGVFLSISIIFVFLSSDVGLYLLQTQGWIYAGGYFKNITAAGGILAVTTTLTFALLFNSKNEKQYLNKLLITGFVLQLIGILLTNSRAAFLGLAIGLGFILYILNKKQFFRITITFALLLIFFIIIIPQFYETIEMFLRFERITNNPRSNLWTIASSIIGDHMLWGVGPGMFNEYMYEYLPVMRNTWAEVDIKFISEEASIGHAHNYFLFRFSELGLLGLLTAIVLPILFLYYGIKVIKYYKFVNRDIYIILIGITGSGIALFARSIYEATGLLSYGWITRDLPFWILFSIVIFLYQYKAKEINEINKIN
jgi:O-antigen ligase